jgi:hypothetical protein
VHRGQEAAIFGEATDIVNLVGFALRHERRTAEAGSGAQGDPHSGPPCADSVHNALDLLERPGTGITVRRASPGTQQEFTGKNIERQGAIVAIVAMEDARLLVPMDGIIGRISVEDNRRGWRGMGLQQQRNQYPIPSRRIAADLFVSGLFGGDLRRAQCQPVQRAFACQGLAAVAGSPSSLPGWVWRADEHRQERIMPQAVVIVEVFIAQSNGVDPLFHEIVHRVLDMRWRPLLGKASRQAVQDAGMPFDFASQQRPAIGGDRAAIDTGYDSS